MFGSVCTQSELYSRKSVNCQKHLFSRGVVDISRITYENDYVDSDEENMFLVFELRQTLKPILCKKNYFFLIYIYSMTRSSVILM